MAQSSDVNVDDLRRRARRRLVGAIVLALSAAVFVPMLLESEPKPLGEDVSVRIPPVDNGKFVNKLTPKGGTEAPKSVPGKVDPTRPEPAKVDPPKPEVTKADPAPADAPVTGSVAPAVPTTSTAASPGPVASAPAAAKRSVAEAEQKVLGAPAKAPAAVTPPVPVAAAKAVPVPAPASVDAPKPEPAKVDAAKSEPAKVAVADAAGFSVQLAAFSDDKGANSLVNKLKKSGYPAYTESVNSAKGTLWRVRVGPFPSRDAAGTSRDKLKGDGYSGIVAPAK